MRTIPYRVELIEKVKCSVAALRSLLARVAAVALASSRTNLTIAIASRTYYYSTRWSYLKRFRVVVVQIAISLNSFHPWCQCPFTLS